MARLTGGLNISAASRVSVAPPSVVVAAGVEFESIELLSHAPFPKEKSTSIDKSKKLRTERVLPVRGSDRTSSASI